MSQSELAAKAGVAPAQISRYESGKHEPRPHVAARLAAALDCSVAWLFNGEQDLENPAALSIDFVHRADGGADIGVELSAKAAAELQATADKLGIDKERLLTAFVLEGLANRAQKAKVASQADIDAIARRVIELLGKDVLKPGEPSVD